MPRKNRVIRKKKTHELEKYQQLIKSRTKAIKASEDAIYKMKKARKLLIEFINYKNKNRIAFTHKAQDEMNTHLKKLIQIWRRDSKLTVDDFFVMKRHHRHLNTRINHPQLKAMWEAYICSTLSLRTKLLYLNSIMADMEKQKRTRYSNGLHLT